MDIPTYVFIDYKVATFSKFNLTDSGIIMQSLD